ncbi:MAG: hypothetical protein ABI652_04685 [Acidobacteriota bacterium]
MDWRTAPPSVKIANGGVTATVYLPDAAAGFYRGTRFDWSGVIGRLDYRGHTFYAPWFTKFDATVRDFVNDGSDIIAGPQSAITGPVEEFTAAGQGFGYAEAAPGGTFVKIGVGVLRKPADGSPYSAFTSYEVVDPGRWTVDTHPDSVVFTHEVIHAASGVGYLYTKTIRLTADRPVLVMSHRLVNRGAHTICSTVYNHNFLVLDGQPPGPDFVITAPFDLQTPRPLDAASASIIGKQFTYAKPLVDRDRVSTDFLGYGATAADYRLTIENRKVGAGVEIAGDRPLTKLTLWSIRSVLALEPFLTMTVDPGKEFTWEYTYRYYTT